MSGTRQIDFTALSLKYPYLKQHFNSSNKYDFSTNKSIIDLTTATIQDKYNLNVVLSQERLCPRVPNRAAYLTFLKKLSDETVSEGQLKGQVWNIDIGTGSSCIYPLLGSRMYNWRFLGTEIDDLSIENSLNNIKLNKLEDSIKLYRASEIEESFFQVEKYKKMVSTESNKEVSFMFSMCNPPFYSSMEELKDKCDAKKTSKSTMELKASECELVTKGGEVGFISKMITESIKLESQVAWYTSMVGNLESAYILVDKLKESGISNYIVEELSPGGHGSTRRWVLAWSFRKYRPIIVYHSNKQLKKLNPVPTINQICTKTATSDVKVILDTLSATEIDKIMDGFELKTCGDVWSRSYRRKMKRLEILKEDNPSHKKQKLEYSYTFSITMNASGVSVIWKYGQDFKIYESFCGFMRREIENKKAIT